MKTHPSVQTLGFFDVELRVQWLEAKGSPVSPLDGVINERILPALQWAAVPQGKAGAAIGLINLIYNLARSEQTRLLPRGQVVRLKLLLSEP